MDSVTPELLARHDGWLRALIRRLVDGDDADDVLQEVWGQVAQRPPRDRKALPAFLATVARRVAGRHRRTATRREGRERLVAQAPAEALGAGEVVARAEERHRVTAAVLELDEPFRSTLLLRYFEDCSPAEIARRQNVAVATVRTRLHRAHARLRERFARERGEEWRGQLAAVCATLGSGDGGGASANATPASAKLTWALAAASLIVATGVWLLVQTLMSPARAPEGASRAAAADPVTTHIDQVAGGGHEAPVVEREVVASRQDPQPALPALEPRLVEGVVLDPRGRPLGGTSIRFRRDGADGEAAVDLGVADASGFFRVRVPMALGQLIAGGECVTLRSWPMNDELEVADALLVACKSIRVAGSVVDPEGRPQPGRKVAVWFSGIHGFPLPTAGTKLVHPEVETESDAEGRFELTGVPAFPAGDLRVDSFRAVVPLPEEDTQGLRVTLGQGRPIVERKPQPPQPELRHLTLSLRATDGAGAPVDGPIVYIAGVGSAAEVEEEEEGDASQRVDAAPAERHFSFETRASDPLTVWVAAPGFGAAEREVWFDASGEASLVLRLDAPGLELSGSVLDTRGRAVPNALVLLEDPTLVDPGMLAPRFVEAPVPHDLGPHAETDPDGAFRIEGILARPYRLRVVEPATGYAATFGPFQAGPPVLIQVPERRVRPALQIVVRGSDGRPVARAEVTGNVVQRQLEDRANGATFGFTSMLEGVVAGETDARGVVEFANAPGGDLQLVVQRSGYVTAVANCARGDAVPFEIVLRRELLFRVEAQVPANRMLGLRLLDAAGRELEVLRAPRNSRVPSTWSFGIHRGLSVVAAVDEAVRRAELYDMFSGEVLRAMSVVADPEGVTVLTFRE